MKHAKALTMAMATLALTIGSVSDARAHCGNCGHGSASKDNSATKDIVDTAIAAGDFSTLVTAIKAAGLVDTLRSEGPFTVFAPTDEAFAKLPKATLAALLADPDRLGAILKYHVVPGRVMAADVVRTNAAKTVLGQSVSVDTENGVKVGGANVVQTDIEASNGVIHVIDTVLLPKSDIIETARSAGSFTTLLTALDAADLTEALRADGPFTVFAPTDDAFAKLPAGTIEALLKDIPKLKAILNYHVVQGKVLAADVVKLSEAKTLSGELVNIDASNGVKVNTASVSKADVLADNGVIHVIDEVLLPPSAKQANATMPSRDLIQRAIDRGVPLFNDGHHAACAAVYEVAAMGLLANRTGTLTPDVRTSLEGALAAIRRSNDATQNAWTMRHALDAAYQSMSNTMQPVDAEQHVMNRR